MLKTRVEEFERQHGHIGSKSKAQIMQLVTDLDENALDETKSLLDDRNSSATNPYGWKISAIIDLSKGKFGNRVFWGNRREARKARRWLVVLRGGVLDSPREEFQDMPERFSNPWEDEYPRQRLRSRVLYRRETEFKSPLKEDSRKGDIAEGQVDVLLKKEGRNDSSMQTYTRMARRHISLEVLNDFKVDYTIDEVSLIIFGRWQQLTTYRILIMSLSRDGSPNMNKNSCGPARETSESEDSLFSLKLRARRNTARQNSNS
jgi:hypothetical protein